ncbi:Protein of unknown function [Cotesia congregata]|uniref:Uncharacterized protein n=1 Tax=Cotesia congregata TaxID=51543 RepID=A0A8J2HF48_COTCN|nr:Protein of unknown function [Cotesia congregata]
MDSLCSNIMYKTIRCNADIRQVSLLACVVVSEKINVECIVNCSYIAWELNKNSVMNANDIEVTNTSSRMASSDRKEEEDLIDLDGRACVSVVPVPETVTSEEHLLDVNPPQLEQKLSLTREQKLVRQHCDNGDVLVTLGHDQVVPVRKRIDVVSSETIKRIRVITKNLEPVIKASQQQIRRSSESENNNEFNGPRTHLGDDESTSGLDVNNVEIKAPDGNELSRGNGEKTEDKKLWARNSDGLFDEFNCEPSTSNHQILPTHSKSSSIGYSTIYIKNYSKEFGQNV